MRNVARRVWDALMLLAILWTVYEEQRYLSLYLAGTHAAASIIAVFDIAVTAILLGYALYELCHLAGLTHRYDRFIAAHRAYQTLIVFLLAALCWGVFRDAIHFHHQYLATDGDAEVDEVFDEVAAGVLGLGVLKLAYHTIRAVRTLETLIRTRLP